MSKYYEMKILFEVPDDLDDKIIKNEIDALFNERFIKINFISTIRESDKKRFERARLFKEQREGK
jgi:ribosomal protein L23